MKTIIYHFNTRKSLLREFAATSIVVLCLAGGIGSIVGVMITLLLK